jgi:SpoVK/Ycf46/Vps4 family AAA+-type ATPase
MFLASLGGNQNIENLLVFGSTNFRNQIDEAILRRFTPSFYVQLPSPKDRG